MYGGADWSPRKLETNFSCFFFSGKITFMTILSFVRDMLGRVQNFSFSSVNGMTILKTLHNFFMNTKVAQPVVSKNKSFVCRFDFL